MDDNALLEEYARTGAESPFATVVQRYAGLVYSAALRQVRDPQYAEDVTQAVFVVLARKAGQVAQHPGLSGWLLRTTRYTASVHIRTTSRRIKREQESVMQTEPSESSPVVWTQMESHLDEAMSTLGETDRAVLAMRYFENKTAIETGHLLNLTEEATKKRTTRALEKLRKFLKARRMVLSSGAIAAAISTSSVQAAPVGLAAKISAAATIKGTAGLSTLALAKSTLKILAWSKYKSLATYTVPVLVAGSVVVMTAPRFHPPKPVPPRSPVPANPISETIDPLAGGTLLTLDSPPGALAIQSDGKIVLGTTLFGEFVDTNSGAFGFFSRGALRLNPDGTLDPQFVCDVGRSDSASQQAKLSVSGNGSILMSGVFNHVDKTARPGYAMLKPDGRLDETFVPWRGITNPPGIAGAEGVARSAWLPDGSIAITSANIEGRWKPFPPTVYRFDTSGRWIPPTNQVLAGTFSRPSGLIATLGSVGFWTREPIDWTNTAPVLPRPPTYYGSELLDISNSPPVSDMPFGGWTEKPTAAYAAIALRALFEEVPLELCRYAVRLPDGGTILATRDRVIDGSISAPGRFIRFDKNWLPDFSFTNSYEADLRSEIRIKRQKDGMLIIGGLIGKLDGEDFPGLVRLKADGEIDRSFHCTTTNSWQGRVMDIAIQDDGKIVICGFFTSVNGTPVPRIARLNPDGSLDATFQSPLMTSEQFNQARFGGGRKLPVVAMSGTNGTAKVVTAPPESILITYMQYNNGAAVVSYTGKPDHQYVLEAKDSLGAGDWSIINTNQTSGNGAGTFRDADAGKFTTRFYRVASP